MDRGTIKRKSFIKMNRRQISPKKRILVYFVVLGIFAISLFAIEGLHTIAHEEAHAQINKLGCDNITIEYGFLYQGGVTKCTLKENISEERYLLMRSLNSQNEIIGYNIATMNITMLLAAFLIVTGMVIIK